jgi:hypothetical protein
MSEGDAKWREFASKLAKGLCPSIKNLIMSFGMEAEFGAVVRNEVEVAVTESLSEVKDKLSFEWGACPSIRLRPVLTHNLCVSENMNPHLPGPELQQTRDLWRQLGDSSDEGTSQSEGSCGVM